MRTPIVNGAWHIGRCFFVAILSLLSACALRGGESYKVKETCRAAHSVVGRIRAAEAPLNWPAAHRGLHSVAPANSLAAIGSAYKLGIPLIEIDLRATQEGSTFLFHDAKLSHRNSYSPQELWGRELSSLTAPEISAIKLDEKGVGVPRFSEALKFSSSTSGLLLDIKGEEAPLLDEIVKQVLNAKAECSVIFQCQRLETLVYLRKNYPGLALLFRAFSRDDIEHSLKYYPEIIQVDKAWLNKEVAILVHNSGAQLLVKSLDEEGDNEETWGLLLKMGVDIVLTDYPLEFLHFVRRYTVFKEKSYAEAYS